MKNKNFITSTILIIIAIIFTVLVKVVDVMPAGANGTDIGFATINTSFLHATGVNMIWYHITEVLGILALLIAFTYAVIGALQLIKRKSLLKVDKELLLLGLFYFIVIIIYVFFEKVIINYRPILIDGSLEASYPSSHTLMIIFICGSAILINKKLFPKIPKIVNILIGLMLIITIFGRLISGVHWFTDIIGGILISSSLLMIFYSLLNSKRLL